MLSKTTIAATLTVLTVTQVAAMPTFPAKLPNGANVNGVDALGHKRTSGGGALNDFGAAFSTAGLKWTKELCQADSDGDGQTNGQELGDPCCVWVEDSNEKVQWSTGVSHPGLATSKSDPSLWASVTCGSSSAVATGSNSTATTAAPATGATTTAPSTTTTAPTPTPSQSSASASLLAAASFVVATALAATLV